MTWLLNILLVASIIFLLLPSETMKRLRPALLPALAAAALCAALWLGLPYLSAGADTVTLTALDQKNSAGEGTEIWIESVAVDGVEYAPEAAFTEGWISEDGYLKWRHYDRPEGMTSTISLKIPVNRSLDIRFDSNKWRGKVKVQQSRYWWNVLDCYSSESKAGAEVKSFRELAGFSTLRINGKVLQAAIFASLLVLAGSSELLRRLRRKKAVPEIDDAQSAAPQRDRELWLDVVKVISGFLIVQIHTVGSGYSSASLDSQSWFGYLILNTIPRCAVPLFIMISGILLIGREAAPGQVWRRTKKALLLLLFWNCSYIVLQSLLWGSSESILRLFFSVPIKRGSSGHLWYSYLLVWIYLFSPIVNALYQALSNRMRQYFVLLTVLIPGILDLYLKVFEFSGSETLRSFQLTMTLSYMGMMVLGRLAYENADRIKRLGFWSLLCTAIGFFATLIITYVYCQKHGKATDIFLSENRFFVVWFSVGLLGLAARLKHALNSISGGTKRALRTLSKYGVGIYFAHVVAIWTLGDIAIGPVSLSQKGSPMQALALVVIYYLITVAGVLLMSRIPFLKKLTS